MRKHVYEVLATTLSVSFAFLTSTGASSRTDSRGRKKKTHHPNRRSKYSPGVFIYSLVVLRVKRVYKINIIWKHEERIRTRDIHYSTPPPLQSTFDLRHVTKRLHCTTEDVYCDPTSVTRMMINWFHGGRGRRAWRRGPKRSPNRTTGTVLEILCYYTIRNELWICRPRDRAPRSEHRHSLLTLVHSECNLGFLTTTNRSTT